ncbi:MAG: peptidase, partial [Candidatus Bathyarchaeia archaeon]
MIVKLDRRNFEYFLREAEGKHPIEACGVIFGSINGEKAHIEKIVPLRNMLESETMFQIDPEEFLK